MKWKFKIKCRNEKSRIKSTAGKHFPPPPLLLFCLFQCCASRQGQTDNSEQIKLLTEVLNRNRIDRKNGNTPKSFKPLPTPPFKPKSLSRTDSSSQECS